MNDDALYMKEAIRLARQGMMANAGGPFGAVVVHSNGQIIGRGYNKVTSMHDPTAHAEIMAIRDACRFLGAFRLDECVLYSTCEPCPMCLGAIYWARIGKLVYAASRDAAAQAGFDDALLYKEFALDPDQRRLPVERLMNEEAAQVFREWIKKEDKVEY